MADDFVDYKILIDAVQAVEILRNLSLQATTFKQRMDLATASVRQFNEKTGYGLRNTANMFKSLDKGIADATKTSTIFGSESEAGWNRAGRAAKSNTGNILGHFSAIRVAAGVLVASLISGLFQSITQFFQGAIKQATQFETTLYRLSNAERQLSMEGVEVTLKGLKEGIKDIQDALPIFSKEDVSELIGSLAVSTKELGFNEDQILKLGAAISILNLNSSETESLLQTQAKVTNSLISPQAKSIGALGLSFGKAKIEAKAFEMQLLQTGQSFDDLTEKQKTDIKYQIVLETAGIEGIDDISKLKEVIESAGGDFAALDEYLQSDTAKIQENVAAWKDLQTTVGQVLLPFIPVATGFFQLINDGFQTGKVVLIEWLTLLGSISTVSRLFFSGHIKNINDFTSALKESFSLLRTDLVNTFFKEMPDNAPEWFKRGWGDLIKEDAETATESIQELSEAVEELDTEKMLDEVQDILDKSREAQEDLDIEMGRKTLDLDVEYDRKGADAYLDYQRKVEDINRDTEDKITEIKQKRREEDVKREAEYQNKLWELQQKYLMDLEDALHNRDARQIIRLQRQYELEKQTLERKNELDAKQSRLDEKSEIKKVRDDQKDKLGEAAVDYQRKLQDLNIAKAREQEDLQKWYDREQQDIQLDQDRKLQALTEGWVEAGLLTEENAARIYGILAGYFGPGGLTDQIYAYMRASLAQAMSMAGGISLPMGQPAPYSQLAAQSAYTPTSTPIQQLTSGGYKEPYKPVFIPKPGGYAEGGAFLATTRDSITVGERGPELVQTTPIGRIGNDVNKLFMGAGGESGGESGALEIGVSLSPDLEARVIRKTMDSAANVILKVNRTKV